MVESKSKIINNKNIGGTRFKKVPVVVDIRLGPSFLPHDSS